MNPYKVATPGFNELSMEEQLKSIDDTLKNWQGSIDQVDDILIIGIKV